MIAQYFNKSRPHRRWFVIDPESREVLISLCEIVKAQALYLNSIQTGMVRIFEIAKEEIPTFEARYTERVKSDLFYKEYAGAREQLQTLSSLLEKLRKP
jgi:hypothetical protein